MEENIHAYTRERMQHEMSYDPDWLDEDALKVDGKYIACACENCSSCSRTVSDDPKNYCNVFLKEGDDSECGDCLVAECNSEYRDR